MKESQEKGLLAIKKQIRGMNTLSFNQTLQKSSACSWDQVPRWRQLKLRKPKKVVIRQEIGCRKNRDQLFQQLQDLRKEITET
jgi:hypothetical protein